MSHLKMKFFSLYHFHRTDLRIDLSAHLRGEKYMQIGRHFCAGRGLCMEAIDEWKPPQGVQRFHPSIVIGDNVNLSDYVHIGCVNKIIIGDFVLMGSKIYITDHNHGVYKGTNQDSPDLPPIRRQLTAGQAVIIENNVWLGDNVVVMPGVTIGHGSIIGSLSVVTHDVPPECIAVGSPARVIKYWNDARQMWENVNQKIQK